jgi:hypothetical protein
MNTGAAGAEVPQGLKPGRILGIYGRPEGRPLHLKGLRKKSAMKIYRRLKPALDDKNKQLIGTTEVVP